MVKLNSRITGGTLLETLVAMVILMIIALGFFASVINIEKMFNNNYKVHAYSIFLDNFNTFGKDLLNGPEEIKYNSCRVYKSISRVKKNQDLLVFNILLVNNNGNTVFEARKYVFISELDE